MQSLKLALVMFLASLILSGCLPGFSSTPSPTPNPTPSAPAQPTSQYQPYTAEGLAAATNQRRVLFFHAAWDPTCQKLDEEITAQLSGLPERVVIFKVEYDSQLELKKKFGVTYQHTLVELDTNDQVIQKWSANDFEEVVAKL